MNSVPETRKPVEKPRPYRLPAIVRHTLEKMLEEMRADLAALIAVHGYETSGIQGNLRRYTTDVQHMLNGWRVK